MPSTPSTCPECFHLWSLHQPEGCRASVVATVAAYFRGDTCGCHEQEGASE